jgi:hypothetical protein
VPDPGGRLKTSAVGDDVGNEPDHHTVGYRPDGLRRPASECNVLPVGADPSGVTGWFISRWFAQGR